MASTASAASAAAKKKLVVCGGSGFLGSRICKAATARGWDVTSLSRSGEPNWSTVTSSPNPPFWSKSVTWAKADILKPSTYSPHLQNADYVVHSMGILFEADYKGVLQGRESPLSGLRRAFSASKRGTQNPLQTDTNEDLAPQEHDGQLTYEVMNRDTVVRLAQEATKLCDQAQAQKQSSASAGSPASDSGSTSPSASQQVHPAFAFISASAGAPILPERYISTKREAEEMLASSFPRMRSFFVRPGMMYDASRSITVGLAGITMLGSIANNLTGGRLTWLMGAGGSKPLQADVVAEAVVEAFDDANVKGVLEVADIERLANTAWRKGML